ncbi:NUDIX hydrolase [Variovorax sp. RA8]|uniref:NUDIX hydrolase n=1 Tax=Variovorax sp. (strain JCM 16519 / RA8) TaxID=662548 RepID=UPI001316FDC3|nr:NUDIX hydrolase [Variovorax sp. RA8]VTU14368.1 NUDIX domain protein [Variovorax sp. RA8]
MTAFHPRLDDAGKPVAILRPSTASPPAAWNDPDAIVTVPPGGAMPAELHGVPFVPWSPTDDDWWNAEAARQPVVEPPWHCPEGKAAAAGIAIVEPDGRLWLAQPSNGFGGVAHVVPKGRRHDAGSLAAAALREAWEEVGLLVRVTGHLIDLPRSMTFTRYFIGRRIGGSPAAMHWESQGAVLCPIARLHELLTGAHDAPLVAAILVHLG